MEAPRPAVPRVKMADALSSYISDYKFKFKFNLKIENCKFELKKRKCIFSYMHTDLYIVYFSI